MVRTLKALQADKNIQTEHQKRLALLEYLYTASNYSTNLVHFCLSQQELKGIRRGSLTRPRELAENVARIKAPADDIDEADWIQLRKNLFTQYPTSVMCGLLSAGMIPDVEDARDSLLSVLHAGIEIHDFDISKQQVKILLGDKTLRAELETEGDNLRENDVFAEVPVDRRDRVVQLLFVLQRLQSLVYFPDDVGAFMKGGYRSAEDIANLGQRAVSELVGCGLTQERAERVYNQAVTVSGRGNGLWTSALKLRGTGTTKDVHLAAIDGPLRKDKSSLKSVLDTVSMGCVDCASVTGPAAFFTDLLRTLASLSMNGRSLLQELLDRRPDLVKLQLSCSNTETLIPYIDLVNEVLESVAWSLSSNNEDLIPPFNMDDEQLGEDHLVQPANVNYDVYEQLIQPMVFPLTVFPYNHAVQCMRAYLTALGTTRYTFLTTLQSPYAITADQALLARVEEALRHACSAEYLGLQHEDYVALAGEGFYSYETAKQLQPEEEITEDQYNAEIGKKAPSSLYWGYGSDEEMTSSEGLTMIRAQLLPRSGLSFESLLNVFRSEYLKNQLIIEIEDPKPEHTPGELLDRMRVREWDGEQPVPLTTPMCDRLHRFLRLERTLQWPLEDLDPVLTTLTALADGEAPAVVDMLAATGQLAKYGELAPRQLQPFWGPFSTHDQNSLYFRLFLKPALPAKEREAFTPGSDGQLPGTEKLSDHKTTVLMGLSVSDGEYLEVMKMLQMPDLLSIENLSKLYRVVTFCKIIGVQPSSYGNFLRLFPADWDPFRDPMATLDTVERYSGSLPASKKWTFERLCFALKGIPNATDEACNPSTEKILKIVHSLTAGTGDPMKNKIDLNLPAADIVEHLELITSTLLGVPASGSVLQFLEVGSTMQKEEFERILSSLAELGPTDPGQLYTQIQQKQTINERQNLFLTELLPAFRAVENSRSRQAIVDTLRSELPSISTALLDFILNKVVYFDLGPELGNVTGMDILLKTVQSPTPTCGQGYFLPPAADRYVIGFWGADSPASLRVDDVHITFDNNCRGTTEALTGGRFYRFQYSDSLSDLTYLPLSAIGTQPTPFQHGVFVEDENFERAGNVVVALMRISILVQNLELDVSEFEFSSIVRSSTGKLDFSKLNLQDVQDLQQYHILRQEFTEKGADLPLLQFYKWVFSKPESFDELPDKLSLVTARPRDVCAQFLGAAYTTLLVDGTVDQGLGELFHSVGTLFIMWKSLRFAETDGLRGVPLDALYAIARPSWKDIVATDFDSAAKLRVGVQTSKRGPNALTAANNEVRDSQRTAVATYLLSSEYAQEHQLMDQDSLFEHFLIDVQMGPDMQTSRMKQATSSIQLFIHRCSLGLEDPTAQEMIKASEIDFMLRYRLWEANRKAYLYPENWLDPSLRDTKSDQFRALESALLQTKLDHSSIHRLVRQYIYDIDDVANLQIEAYVLDERARADTLHIFGRTRTSPFLFYYRRVTVPTTSYYTPTWTPWTKIDVDITVYQTGPDGGQLPKPRSYLIPAVYRGRLYLFLPEITVKETPNMPERFDQNVEFKQIMPTQSWEVRMAYSEFRDGGWQPKSATRSFISRNILNASGVGVDISSFKFWVDYEPRLSIRVECLQNKSTSLEGLGRFQLQDQQLVLVGSNSLPTAMISSNSSPDSDLDFGKTITTDFLKYKHLTIGGVLPAPIIEYGEGIGRRTVTLHLGRDDRHSLLRHLEWTIDFSSQVPGYATALIVETTDTTSIGQFIDLGKVHDFGISYMTNRYPPLLLEYMDKFEESPPVNEFYQTLSEDQFVDAFGQWREYFPPSRVLYHEGAQPSSLYNWELGVHIPCLILERLMTTQQFDLALKVARQIYDPRRTSPVNACWSFPPFRRIAEDPNQTFPDPSVAEMSPDEWQENKANTHAAARNNPRAYMTRIVMKYLEILISLGDEWFRRETLEAMPLATQMYVEAAHIFGPQPMVIPELGKRSSVAYEDIEDSIQGWNAEVEMELDFPYYVKPDKRGVASPISVLPRSTIRTGYFCIPGNPALVALRDRIDDRLFKIRNGMDINGNKRSLALYEPPIDPGALVRAMGSGGTGIAGLLGDLDSPMPRYRFQYLIGRASELVGEVRNFGSQVLACKESKDAEKLATIQQQHQSTMAALTMRIRDCQKVEIEKSMESLLVSREKEEMRLAHLLALTGDDKAVPARGEPWKDISQRLEPPTGDDFRMSRYEQQALDQAETARGLQVSAEHLEMAGAAVAALPEIGAKAQPMGAGIDTTIGGDQIGGAIAFQATALQMVAAQHEIESERAAQKGEAIEKLQERRLEANTVGRELTGIDKDLEQLEASLATWNAEVQAQQQEIDNAAAEEEWMRTKYTSEEFYTLMESRLSSLFRQTFLMAVDMIKAVRRAMEFELGLRQPAVSNVASIASSWETCRDGLLSGDVLAIELQTLQTAFEMTKRWDYEIYRSVSLRTIDPEAFLQLRETGSASFEIRESLFDRDFPGHYCRRLMETEVYTPGANASVGCTLTLTEHKYRISATSSSYKEQKAEDFRTDKIPIQSIAVTRGRAANNGKFDPTFYGANEYFPFEGAGVISKWSIELANELRQFNYANITDVELDLKYGALAGGDRDAALKSAAEDLASGRNVASIDLINDLTEPDGAQAKSSPTVIEIKDLRDRMPYITTRGETKVKAVKLFVKSKNDTSNMNASINTAGDGLELADQDVMGEFVIRSSEVEENVGITDTWKVEFTCGEDNTPWEGSFDEAWLLISYSVTGLVTS